jgi:hypothetical protein
MNKHVMFAPSGERQPQPASGPHLRYSSLVSDASALLFRYVKGYLAFKSRVLVLAKADAFPLLSAAQQADPFQS